MKASLVAISLLSVSAIKLSGPASDSSEKNIERNTDPVGFAGGAPNHDYYTDARHRQSEDDF